jgi:hypothetical protein
LRHDSGTAAWKWQSSKPKRWMISPGIVWRIDHFETGAARDRPWRRSSIRADEEPGASSTTGQAH